jgi:UPF0755 protein
LQILFAVTFLLAGLAAYILLYPVSLPKQGAIFYVAPGVSRDALVYELAGQNLVRFPALFDLYVRARGKVPVHSEYTFHSGSSPYTIWKQIISGSGRHYRAFTIIPGWTFKQVKTALLNDPTLRHVTKNMSDADIMAVLGDAGHTPEGLFLPETYYYSRGDADLAVLKRAHNLMEARLNEAWEMRAPNLPFQNAYEALIAASLIEKEAYLPQEQPVIGGVLVNRLKKNMLLQFDPTVIYGMGDAYQGKIYKKDLETDTPYNTYIHKGLTPTPIAMPGFSAIKAALHPDVHDYLYFVAKGDGSHAFTTNLESHINAVKKAEETHKQAEKMPSAPGA